MPVVNCPGCGRQLGITADEIAAGLVLECARCNSRFRTKPPPPADPTADLADPEVPEPAAAPAPLRRTGVHPAAAAGIALFALGTGILIGSFAGQSGRPTAAATKGPVPAPPGPTASPPRHRPSRP